MTKLLVYRSLLKQFLILGKELAGTYDKIPNATFNGCIVKCCETEGCNVVFMHKTDCYTVQC